MKISKTNLLKKIVDLLKQSTSYISAPKLADACNCSVSRIYGIIRTAREGQKDRLPLGIHSVRNGYILSEYATKTDDVEFFRRLNGARTSVYVTANAAASHIRNRWNTIEDRKAYDTIMKPFAINGQSALLKMGAKILLNRTKAGI